MFSHLDGGSPARGMRSRTWRRSLGTGFQPRGEGHGLAGVKQVTLAKALRLTQPYVSDVARGRYRTITVENVPLGQQAQLLDVLLGDAQLRGLIAARRLDPLGRLANALGRGALDDRDGGGRPHSPVELPLLGATAGAATVRSRPRWSRRIRTRIAHGIVTAKRWCS